MNGNKEILNTLRDRVSMVIRPSINPSYNDEGIQTVQLYLDEEKLVGQSYIPKNGPWRFYVVIDHLYYLVEIDKELPEIEVYTGFLYVTLPGGEYDPEDGIRIIDRTATVLRQEKIERLSNAIHEIQDLMDKAWESEIDSPPVFEVLPGGCNLLINDQLEIEGQFPDSILLHLYQMKDRKENNAS
jgi:hypothetical protein